MFYGVVEMLRVKEGGTGCRTKSIPMYALIRVCISVVCLAGVIIYNFFYVFIIGHVVKMLRMRSEVQDAKGKVY